MLGLYWGYIGAVLGQYQGYLGVILGLYWGYIKAILGLCWGYIGAILGLYEGYIGAILWLLRLYCVYKDNGQENGNWGYIGFREHPGPPLTPTPRPQKRRLTPNLTSKASIPTITT